MKSRGQAAMEQMAIYGWSMAIILLVGVVLWQMWLFTSSGAAAPGVSGFGSVRPIEWACDADTGSLRLSFLNAAGQSVTNLTVLGGSCDIGPLGAGEDVACMVYDADGCASVNAGDRYKSSVTVAYISAGGLSRESTGLVWGAAE